MKLNGFRLPEYFVFHEGHENRQVNLDFASQKDKKNEERGEFCDIQSIAKLFNSEENDEWIG